MLGLIIPFELTGIDFCMTALLHTTVVLFSRLTMPVLMGKYSYMAIFCSSSRAKPM